MKKILFLVFIISLIFIFSLSNQALAKIGVGVGTGKITIDENLKPGKIYELPPLTVVNTGDESSRYEVAITYHQDQPEMMPSQNWFIFEPKEFFLNPGEAQKVDIKLNLPLRVEPGDYFAYLEAHPLKKSETKETTISIAAASKLYFKILPANIFQAIFYKLSYYWSKYYPWSLIFLVAVLILIFVLIFRHYFSFQLMFSKRNRK